MYAFYMYKLSVADRSITHVPSVNARRLPPIQMHEWLRTRLRPLWVARAWPGQPWLLFGWHNSWSYATHSGHKSVAMSSSH